MKKAWIQTYTGEQFEPLNPRPESINIADIAHALAMICRYNGHCMSFYSVAEHCTRMSEMVPRRFALHALLHDAAEAYISDVARPIKPLLPAFAEMEAAIMAAICQRVGLTWTPEVEAVVHNADLRMLATEKEQLMGHSRYEWESLRGIKPYTGLYLFRWEPTRAKIEFLQRFKELTT